VDNIQIRYGVLKVGRLKKVKDRLKKFIR